MAELHVDAELMEFIHALVVWHTRQRSQLEELVEGAKAGIKLKVETSDGTVELELNDDQAFGLKIGAETALMLFAELPFKLN